VPRFKAAPNITNTLFLRQTVEDNIDYLLSIGITGILKTF
jgi:hypothetical protein